MPELLILLSALLSCCSAASAIALSIYVRRTVKRLRATAMEPGPFGASYRSPSAPTLLPPPPKPLPMYVPGGPCRKCGASVYSVGSAYDPEEDRFERACQDVGCGAVYYERPLDSEG